MARRSNSDGETEVGPIDEREFRKFLKRLDLAQKDVDDKAEELKTARSGLSAIWKEFKKAGGKNDVMRAVMGLRNMDDGDRYQFEEDRRSYANWMKLPLGAQSDMFGDDAGESDEADAPEPEPEMTARSRRGPKPAHAASKSADNPTGSPLN